MSSAHVGRFDHYVGIVSPPASFDPSPQHFLDVAPERVGAIQHICHVADYTYGPDIAPSSLDAFKTGVAALAASDADIIAQMGGYWALTFTPDETTSRALQNELSQEHGVTIVLVWNAMVDALHKLDARRIVVTTGYYRPAWTAATIAFLEGAGFEVLWGGDLIDQGILPDVAAKEAVETATRWDYPDDIVRRVCLDAGTRAPDADVVVQTGAGMRPVVQAHAIETALGKPLVSTDIALYWGILSAAGMAAKPGHGRLLDTTRTARPAG